MLGYERESHRRRGASITTARGLLAGVLRPYLTLAAVVLIVGTVSGSRAGTAELAEPDTLSAGVQCVRTVEASEDTDRLEVSLTTGTAMTPWFSVFPLREPDRLVFDLPNYIWEPGLTAYLESAHPEVQAIRVGQFSEDPPVTRLVLDLSVPVDELHYRTIASDPKGRLRVRVADEDGAHTILEEKHRRPVVAALPPVEHTPPPPETSGSTAVPPTEAEPPVPAPSPEPPAVATNPVPSETAEPPTTAAIDDPDPIPVVAQVEPPRPTRPELAAGASSASAAPPIDSQPSAGSRALRFAGAIAILAALGFLAFWLRKKYQASPEEAPVIAEESRPDLRPGVSPKKAASLDLVRCRIIDGYLVLAPEGGKTVAESLGHTAQRARIEGQVEIVAAESTSVSEEDSAIAVSAVPESETATPARSGHDGAAGSPAETAETLVAALSDEDVTVRKTAAQGLWTLADGGRADVLVPYLKNADPRVRLVIAGVLGEAGAIQCADELATLLTDSDASVRASTVYAFSQLGAAVSPHSASVQRLLSDPEDLVRARAVEALAALNPQSAEVAGEVFDLLGDPDASVREAAMQTTLGYANRGITPPITAFIGDPSHRAQALELLQQAEDSTLRRLLIAARAAQDEGNSGPMDTISYVVRARWTTAHLAVDARSTEEGVRLAALEGLAILGGDEAIAEISQIAQSDPSTELQHRAAQMLDAAQDLATQTTS
ncbi:MAG: HEAT repeat domain-containing protein [Armatimonadetes bacterium]|nr:HEAT repeat domain-containing protein [Armatimonadota bacterium]